MSTPPSGGASQDGLPQLDDPPYPPRNHGLGGMPSKIPDIPITAIFLFLYLVFGVIHIKIMKYNKHRDHKFIFNGALFGFCKVRVVTMVLRIAWACYPRNVSLAIAAQVFVYVGTIILYLCNWFFTQRVVRAQHPHFGWSTPYRIIHRAGIAALVIALCLIIVGSIQQFFTLDAKTIRIDHYLSLAAFTYFAAFTLAPFLLLFVSFVLPRKGTEKFGLGRLRNAIAVLVVASFILALGQCFRTVISWLPLIPLRNAQTGEPNSSPWYFSKASFYVFNFLTELVVVIMFAVMRVDLRFYVPDGAKKPGDYRSWRESQYTVNVIGNEKKLHRRSGATGSIRSVASHETLHEYQGSVFEDTRTLADSLRFSSSIMEIDDKTGHWKVKRQSNGSLRSSARHSARSQSTLWDTTRATLIDQGGAPPVPSIPQDWPLRDSQLHLGQMPVLEHNRPRDRSSRETNGSRFREAHATPDVEKDDAINQTMRKLEGRSAPPDYDFVGPAVPKKSYQPGSDIPKKRRSRPNSDIPMLPFFPASDDLPHKHEYHPASPSSDRTYRTAPSDLPVKKNYYPVPAPPSVSSRRNVSLTHSTGQGTSINTEAEEEFARFSFEASPRPGTFDEEPRVQEARLSQPVVLHQIGKRRESWD